MSKITQKIKQLFLVLTLATPFMAVSCFNSSNLNEWDQELTIYAPQPNPGFSEEDKTNWEKTLTNYFNETKNNISSLKNKPNVSVKLEFASDRSALYPKFLANNSTNDFVIMSYTDLVDVSKEDLLPSVAQSQTIQFLWTPDKPVYFENKKENDPLYLMAQNANKIQLENSNYGTYPLDWIDNEKKLKWDGSKYEVFYKLGSYTENYYGSILISGTEEQREQIKQAWINKDWDTFRSFGIVFDSSDSLAKFNLPASLIAKNFNLKYSDIVNYLIKQPNDLVSLGNVPESSLGVQTSTGKVYRIAFEYDGVFNWTPPTWTPDSTSKSYNFKPTNYPNEQVRYLTMSGPLLYDAVLARKGISKEQIDIFAQALEKLTYEENTYGIYSGFNKFVKMSDKELLNKYSTLKEMLKHE